uniref:Neurofilament heavy polypeptide-like isoform X2 n=1 Tax=Diabrotica virgifera virgifera TaxID=50390 RepID=A0A6P7G9F1_DIAVI
MNTTLNPVTSQTSSASPNKPMHPQGAPVSYGQPSGPIAQNPYPNTNMAHNHPPSQQNHYSLGGSSPFNMGAIPASNHPLANNQSSSGQVYNAPKNVSYSSGFQNAQNQNTLPPVVQTLPATNPTATPQGVPSSQNLSNSNSTVQGKEPSVEKEKPQSNGTTEEEPSTPVEEKPEPQENHVIPESSNTTETSEVQEPLREPPQETPEELTTEKPKSPEQSQQEAETAQQPPQDKVEEAASVSPSVSDSVQDAESIPDPTPDPTPSIAEAAESVTRPITPPTLVTEPAKSATPATPQKEKAEPETVQNETGEEQSNEEATEAENVQKDEDPLAKTPPKTPARKTKAVKPEAKTETKTPQKSPATGKTKRQRMMTQHYQSPLPEIEIITKISSSTPRSKNNDDKLIYFYKNEFLAVRNSEGGFYLCQAIQNVYKSSSKIKIRWLSQDKTDKSGEIYTPDFYDLTDFDCILTSLDLTKVGKGRYKLKPKEKERTDSILKRCLAVEKGEISQPSVSEEHPDGLDLSLYKDEEQLVKKKSPVKRKAPPRSESPKKETPTKKAPETPKVRKVEPKPSKTPTPAKKQTPAKKLPEPKKTPASTSRSARGKRKSEPKTSPVVDQKKAKVLAKIGRKSAVSSSSPKPQSTPKSSAKSPKPTPSTSKATKPAPASSKPPPPRKTKRSTRK